MELEKLKCIQELVKGKIFFHILENFTIEI